MRLKFQVFVAVCVLLLTSCNIGTASTPTPDISTMNTAIVETTVAQISAQFTQTALAVVPPTDTPAPVAALSDLPTLALPVLPDSSSVSPTIDAAALPTFSFVTTPAAATGAAPIAATIVPSSGGQSNLSTASGCNDALFVGETLPDGSVISTGANFTKAWELQNTGTCTWNAGYSFAFLPDVSSSSITGYDVIIKANDAVTDPGHSQSFVVKLTAPAAAGEYKGYWKMKAPDGTFFGPRVYFDIVVK